MDSAVVVPRMKKKCMSMLDELRPPHAPPIPLPPNDCPVLSNESSHLTLSMFRDDVVQRDCVLIGRRASSLYTYEYRPRRFFQTVHSADQSMLQQWTGSDTTSPALSSPPWSSYRYQIERWFHQNSRLEERAVGCCRCVVYSLYASFDTEESGDLAAEKFESHYRYSLLASFENIAAHLPGWVVRLYLDSSWYSLMIARPSLAVFLQQTLLYPHVELWLVNCPGFDTSAALPRVRARRLLPLEDESVACVVMRDADGVVGAIDCHNIRLFAESDMPVWCFTDDVLDFWWTDEYWKHVGRSKTRVMSTCCGFFASNVGLRRGVLARVDTHALLERVRVKAERDMRKPPSAASLTGFLDELMLADVFSGLISYPPRISAAAVATDTKELVDDKTYNEANREFSTFVYPYALSAYHDYTRGDYREYESTHPVQVDRQRRRFVFIDRAPDSLFPFDVLVNDVNPDKLSGSDSGQIDFNRATWTYTRETQTNEPSLFVSDTLVAENTDWRTIRARFKTKCEHMGLATPQGFWTYDYNRAAPAESSRNATHAIAAVRFAEMVIRDTWRSPLLRERMLAVKTSWILPELGLLMANTPITLYGYLMYQAAREENFKTNEPVEQEQYGRKRVLTWMEAASDDDESDTLVFDE